MKNQSIAPKSRSAVSSTRDTLAAQSLKAGSAQAQSSRPALPSEQDCYIEEILMTLYDNFDRATEAITYAPAPSLQSIALRTLLRELHGEFAGVAASAGEMIRAADGYEPENKGLAQVLLGIAPNEWGWVSRTGLETWLAMHAGKEVDGLVLVRSMDPEVLRRWRVVAVEPTTPDPCAFNVIMDELEDRIHHLSEGSLDEEMVDLGELLIPAG